VTLIASPKTAAYAAVGAGAILVALVWDNPQAAAFGMPFIVASLIGLALVERPEIGVELSLDRDRLLEGDDAHVSATLASRTGVPWLQLAWPMPAALAAPEAGDIVGVRLASGRSTTVETTFTATRWGVVPIPPLLLRAHDELGFFRFEGTLASPHVLRVYPRPETLRRAVQAAETQVFGGDELSRAAGDGTEFADTRPYTAGDRPRRINWRHSTRTGTLHVNEMHPERNSDVVIFLDVFTDVRARGRGSLDDAVRAAASLAGYYLARRDRVGVVGFGGILQWLPPAMGQRQLYRIVDALIDSEVVVSHVWRDIDVIPPRMLPPKSLIVALTPLIDGRVINALVDLRARGFDVFVVEVSADRFALADPHESAQLARRLWLLDRDAIRLRYRSLGIKIVTWQPGESLAGPLAQARAFTRQSPWFTA
jgi:uncharacterized protein (DUF58 family)